MKSMPKKNIKKVSAKREMAIDESLGLQTISIRLQKKLIKDLKTLAEENGIGYQPYIRQLLTQHTRDKLKQRYLKIINN